MSITSALGIGGRLSYKMITAWQNLIRLISCSEQALAEGKIVLEMTLETYKEEGLPLPEPKVYAGYSG